MTQEVDELNSMDNVDASHLAYLIAKGELTQTELRRMLKTKVNALLVRVKKHHVWAESIVKK